MMVENEDSSLEEMLIWGDQADPPTPAVRRAARHVGEIPAGERQWDQAAGLSGAAGQLREHIAQRPDLLREQDLLPRRP